MSTSMAPVDTPEDLETTAKLENMRLNIVFMLVGCRGESLPSNADCLLYC
jgi:hypothetical protein